MYTIFTCLYFILTAAILACHSLPHLTFPYIANDVKALCITTLSACSQRPHQRKYSTPSSFTAPPQWRTSNSHLFLTDGVTVPLPLYPSPTLAKPISHANKPTLLPVAKRLARGMHAMQPSFWGEALPNIRWASPYPHPKIHTAGGAPFPIPT